jgi:hypothetical protein
MDDNLYGRHGNPHQKKRRGNQTTTYPPPQILRLPSPHKTHEAQPIPQTREMHVRTTLHRISRSTSEQRNSTHGRCQSRKSPQMAPSFKHHRSPQIPWIHRLLPVFHKRLLKDRKAPTPPHAQLDPLALERRTTTSLQKVTRLNVPTTSPQTTRLHQTLRGVHRRISIWRGSYTLTRGWTQHTKLH